MMHHIDVSSVLRQTLACDLYSNLVTRPTGAAVRGQIELLLGESTDARAYAVIDFSQVSMIDFSCADEVIAKLLMRYAADDSPQEAYFLFRGVSEFHRDAIESVLERHGLALAIEEADGISLLGVLTDVERRAWHATLELGPVDVDEVARAIGVGLDEARSTLDALGRRRLVMRMDGQYMAVGSPRG
jgi:hypothetical protein